LVPTFFIAQGSGDQATFIGCKMFDNGDRALIRMNQMGQVIATQDRLDVQCNDNAQFTDPWQGVRWMLVPPSVAGGDVAIGSIAFDTNTLQVTSVARKPWDVSSEMVLGNAISMNPVDGNAIIWRNPRQDGDNGTTVHRVKPYCLPTNCPILEHESTLTPVIWANQPANNEGDVPFQLEGPSMVLYGPSGPIVFLPGILNDAGSSPTGELVLHHQMRFLIYSGGAMGLEVDNPADPGNALFYELDGSQITYATGDNPHSEFMNMSPDGSMVYLPVMTRLAPDFTDVRAYRTDQNGGPVWRSPSLPAEVQFAIPFGQNGRYLAAVSAKGAWILDATSGQPINPNPIAGSGNYVLNWVTPGPADELYLMFGPATTVQGNAPTLSELVTLKTPQQGELVRYTASSGTLFASVDDSGSLWLRYNNNLAKLLSSFEYTQLANK
jgi:hypothetical protein